MPISWTIGLQNGVVYNVRVRTKVGGNWGDFSNTCTVQLSVPLPQLAASQCGQIITDLSGNFISTTISNVQDYEWEFTNTALGYSYTKNRGTGYYQIPMNWIIGLQNGTTYNVRIRTMIGGVWGAFGNPCTITIAIPLPQVTAGQCGQIISSSATNFTSTVVGGAEDYEWEFTNASLGFSYTKNRGTGYYQIPLTWIPGLQSGVTYSVRIRVMIGGVLGAFGTSCEITMPVGKGVQIGDNGNNTQTDEPSDVNNTLIIYPNPNDGTFTVTNNFETGILEIYNPIGQLIYTKKLVTNNTSIDLSNFKNGIYIVKLNDEQGIHTSKLVIKK